MLRHSISVTRNVVMLSCNGIQGRILSNVNSLQPNTAGTHLQLKKLDLSCIAVWKNTQHGNMGVFVRGFQKQPTLVFGFLVGDFEAGLRKWGSVLDQMLSESRSKPTIGWVSPKILSIRRTDLSKDKAIIAEAAVAQVSQEREMVGVLWFAR